MDRFGHCPFYCSKAYAYFWQSFGHLEGKLLGGDLKSRALRVQLNPGGMEPGTAFLCDYSR